MTRSDTVSTSGEMVNSFDRDRIGELTEGVRSMISRRERLLGPAYRLQYKRPVRFVRGQGVYLYDENGTAYLDAYNNVPSVGHCHPRVVEAVSEQLGRLNTNTRYLDDALLDYAERLIDTHSSSLNNVMFTCSGSEANDLALRVARYHTGGEGVVITQHAYHGLTGTIAELSPTLGGHVPLGRHVRTVPVPFGYGPESGAKMAQDVERAIKDMERHGIKFCAFLADTIFASDGLMTDPAGFLAPVAEVVRKAGGLFIADEVQAGFGRTGESLWGYQRHGIDPDISVMGKPMGNGMPIAGIAVRSEVLERFGRDTRYFNTFGGNTVSIAGAAATLTVVLEEGLAENARTIGSELRSRIEQATEDRPYISDIRGVGLYLGVDLVSPGTARGPELASRLVNAMRDRHVLISATGVNGETLKIRPPLPFDMGHVDQFMNAFESSLEEIEQGL